MEASEYIQHREKLVSIFRASKIESGLIVYKSALLRKEPFTGSDFEFSQEGLFSWLCGWEKPDSSIVIDIATSKSVLYIPKYSDQYEIWNGPIPKEEDVKKITGVDEIRFNEQLGHDIQAMTIYGADNQIPGIDQNALPSAAGLARRIKTDNEIKALREASVLTSDAIAHVMKNIKPGWLESEVDAEFTYYGTKRGARGKSFLTIAASGQSSVYLHNSANEGVCKDGDLLLLDCGFFWNHYAGDVTRTFPVNGKFNEDQRKVYSMLLDKQIELIEMVKPEVPFSQLNQKMFKSTFEIIKELGIVKDNSQEAAVAHLFTPHSLTHHVGCNVHDLNEWNSDLIDHHNKEARICKPKMVITIEPGIYFHKARLLSLRNTTEFPSVDFDLALRYADTVGGIRIEDDVLVTENGHEVLSTCPKSVEEIEKIMAKH